MSVWNEVGTALASEFAAPDAGTMTVIVSRVLCAAVLGGIIGTIALILCAPLLADFALNFSSFEYFWLALLACPARPLSQGMMH